MRLENCNLEAQTVVAHPVEHTRPQEPWVSLRDEETIPEALYRFYCTAEYFSYSKAPAFLSDGRLRRQDAGHFERTQV